MRSRRPASALVLTPLLAATLVSWLLLPVRAVGEDWTVINLLPAGASSAQVYCAQDGHQAGRAEIGGRPHAGYWSGSADSWVDLDRPEFALGCSANANWGTTIVGVTFELDEEENDYSRAALWEGSAEHYVDLHPAGAVQSMVHAVCGAAQGGEARFGTSNHAALWYGTAASFTDLHPNGAVHSYVQGMGRSLQVGYAAVPLSHACTWAGSAASWTDLHPPGIFASQGFGTDGVQQVGWTIDPSLIDHPALWTGTAASHVDLIPSGWRDGKALAVFDGRQVGYARPAIGIEYHALLWNGTPDDYVDLHQFLPAGQYIRSTGYGIWHDANHWYVVGQGTRPDYYSDPLLWIATIHRPGDLNCDGAVDFRDVNPFVQYMVDFPAWRAAHPKCAAANGDINGDGVYPSFDDINPFVELLIGPR